MWSYFLALGWKESDSCCPSCYKGSVLEECVAVIKLYATEFIGLNKRKAQMWISGMAGSSNSHYVVRIQTLFIFLIQFYLTLRP